MTRTIRTYTMMKWYVTRLLAQTLDCPNPTKETTRATPTARMQKPRRTKKRVFPKPYLQRKHMRAMKLTKRTMIEQTMTTP